MMIKDFKELYDKIKDEHSFLEKFGIRDIHVMIKSSYLIGLRDGLDCVYDNTKREEVERFLNEYE